MIIRVAGLTKTYAGFTALDDLGFSVPEGVIGLLGPNGAGKSTLIKGLLGLVRLDRGEAKVLDLDARTQSRQIRERAGYMPEDDCYIPGMAGVQTVAYAGELAGLPPRTALRRAHEVLDYVSLADERYREIQTYSTGMKQRIRLAQALIHAPKLVFLDEPTSGLDPQGRDRMLQLIRNLHRRKGVSVVISTHILQDVEACCDRVVILARGKCLVCDELKSLRQSVDTGAVVRFAGGAAPFRASLEARGFAVQELGAEEWKLSGGPEDSSPLVFQAALESGAAVRQLAPSRTSLEEIFLQAVRGGSDARP
jgi:ABC-2 type transport system ATP-binding protein